MKIKMHLPFSQLSPIVVLFNESPATFYASHNIQAQLQRKNLNRKWGKSMCGYIFLFLALFTSACMLFSCKNSKRSSFTGKEIVLKLDTSPENLRNSEGDFIKLKDGRIIFVYTRFTGGQSDHAKAHLAGRYSSDGGKTWTAKNEVILPNEGDMNIMSVSLMRMPDQSIAMFYLRKNSMDDCIPMMRKSYDEAKTWSEPVAVIQDREGYFVMNNDRVIQLENGRILAPVSLHQTPDTEWNNKGKIFCYYSDDSGATWNSSKEVPNSEEIMLQEPGLIVLKNGKIMMFNRTDAKVQYLSYSKDDGETWSDVVPSDINSPRAPASIKRIPSTGDLLLVWNNNRGEDHITSRTHYNTAISSDEGKTWKHVQTVADKTSGLYCYYAIEFVDDEVLLGHIAEWDSDRTGISAQITRVGLNWLYEKK
jgi:sialidase-1